MAGGNSNPKGDRKYLGLKKLRSGGSRRQTPPTPGSKTQQRKANRSK